jgi:hypothetical protein
MLPLARHRPEPAADKYQLLVRGIGHHHDQHFLVDIDSCYLVAHCFLSARKRQIVRTVDYAPLRAYALPRRKGNVTFIGSKTRVPGQTP